VTATSKSPTTKLILNSTPRKLKGRMDKTRQIEDHFDFDQSEMKQDPLQTDDGRTDK